MLLRPLAEELAHRGISLPCGNSVAFGRLERTLDRTYEYMAY
jgi:hypothetical protein